MKIIYLHGLGQSAAAWDAVRALAPGDAPELYALTEDITFAGLYAALEAYLLREAEAVHLVGLSLGGMLAMRYAALHPEKMGALTLIGVRETSPAALLRAQNLLFRLMPERAFTEMNLTKAGTIALCDSMRRLDLTGEAMNIACRTQVVVGAKDRANLAAADALAAHIGAQKWTITGAGHEVNLDAPDKLAAAVLAM